MNAKLGALRVCSLLGEGVGMSAEPSFFGPVFDAPEEKLEQELRKIHEHYPGDFDRFIAYVLQRAGYNVRTREPSWYNHARFEVRSPGSGELLGSGRKQDNIGHVVGVEIATHTSQGTMVGTRTTEQYLFTMGEFDEAAKQRSSDPTKKTHLIDGKRLLRYITYIKGSRRDDDNTLACLSPEFFGTRAWAQTTGRAKVLTVANNKGGVAKTTTAYYLACEWTMRGDRVLLLDLDGQANLTEKCFPESMMHYDLDSEQPPSIANHFADPAKWPLHSLVQEARSNTNLRIIPSDLFLTLRDMGGSGNPEFETRFARDVHELATRKFWEPAPNSDGTADWIIIDTPPAMSVPTRAGLAAAEYVLAPVRPRLASLAGTRNMLRTRRTINAITDNSIEFLGAVITHWDTRKVTEEAIARLQPLVYKSGGRIYDTVIPDDNQLDTLEPGSNKSMVTPGGEAYHALAEEIWKDVHTRHQIRHQNQTHERISAEGIGTKAPYERA